MSYEGDIALGQTIDVGFVTTSAATGAPTTLSGTPVISAYIGNSTTQLTAGITLSVDFDGVTGYNNVRVVASSGNGYATATDVRLVITTGTVGGTSAIGYVVGSFSIENRSAIRPTTAGRTLDVASTGEAGMDLSNILIYGAGPFAPTAVVDSGTAQSVTGTTLVMRSAAAFADSELVGATVVIRSATTGAGQRRLITANVGSTDTITVDTWTTTPTGTIVYDIFGSAPGSTSSPTPVNAVQVGGQTASAAGTITFPGAIASTTNITSASGIALASGTQTFNMTGSITGNLSGSVGSVTGAVGSVTGAVASVTGNVGGNVVGSVASVTGAVGSVTGAVGSVTGNVGGNVTGTVASVVGRIGIKKNTALANFMFLMTDSTTNAPKTGLTVTAQRSLDGGAFAALATPTVTEVANGWYKCALAAADTNGDTWAFKATATGANQANISLATQV